MANNKLYRSETDRILGGVCGGLAETYEVDPTLVRLLTVLAVLATGVGPLLYLIAWLIMPVESEVKGKARDVQEVELKDEENESDEEDTDEENNDEETEETDGEETENEESGKDE